MSVEIFCLIKYEFHATETFKIDHFLGSSFHHAQNNLKCNDEEL